MIIGDSRFPITIVTGFLGSGKTTLLANVLQHEKYKNTAVIINEYGQVGLDHRLIRRIEEKTRLLSGGCICCNMRDDLINELKDILNEKNMGVDEKRFNILMQEQPFSTGFVRNETNCYGMKKVRG